MVAMNYSYKIPYYKAHLELILDERPRAVLSNRLDELPKGGDERAVVSRALDEPVGTPKLEELAFGKKRICIITSDHTRPVPSKLTMPILLERIRRVNPEAEISILIATGFHRPTTENELAEKLGADIVENENIIMHYSGKR